MAFSSMRPLLAGAAIAVSIVGSASAQDAKTVFEARYAELTAATLAKDAVALAKLTTPDFTMTDIQGNEHTATEMREAMDKRPAGAGPSPKVTIMSAQISGATAKVEQQMELHMDRPGPDGTPVKLDVTVLTDDTWVQSGGAWLLQSSDQKDVSVAKDGDVVFHQAK
jgi:ketosteroid isomerase-like protein